MTEFFNCLRISREDFLAVGFNGDKLTDAEMERIASRIGESCMEQFWASLECIAEERNLPKTE